VKIPVIIPARNESRRIGKTIDSLRRASQFAGIEVFIVVVDDGSKDDTSAVAESMNCHVIKLRDRGYSALGMPELADTHNAGFQFVATNYQETYDYVMVSGSDTTYADDYFKLLIEAFQSDSSLVMCAGVLDRFLTNPMAVRGSGRIIKRSFWETQGSRLPNHLYAWESFPVVAANTLGYRTRTIYEARMNTDRPPLRSVDWKRYGIGMRENGSVFPYVALRAAKAAVQISPKAGFRLILGYFSSVKNRYPEEMRQFVKNYQVGRILKYLKLKR